MKIKVLHTLILLLFPFLLFSQSAKITGTIIEDSNSEKMAWVNVILLDKASGEIIKGKTTDVNGSFFFYGLKPKSYIIEVSFIGFQKSIIEVEIKLDNELFNIGNVILIQSAIALDDVVIISERATLTQDGGKTILNVSESLGQSATMVDLLENIPSIQASEDEGISIRGQKPILLIDGVESSADEFNSISPNIISSVEVHTNASAKYSGSKVINVVLHSESYQKQMYKGQLFYGAYNFFKGQFNGVVKKNRWSFSTGVYVQNNNIYKKQSLIRVFDLKDQTLNQEKRDTVNTKRFRYFANVAYKLNKTNRFAFRFNYVDIKDTPNIFLENQYVQIGNTDNLRINKNNNTRQNYSFLGQWQHKLKDGSSIELSTKLQKQPSYRVNDASTVYPGTNTHTRLDRFTFDEDKQYKFMKLDYEKSMSTNFSIEAGAEAIITHNNMDSEVLKFNNATNEWEENTEKSYNFIYKEQKYTGYISSLYLMNKWEFNIGIRAEYIHWQSMIPDVDSVAVKSIFVPSPIVGLTYNFTNQQVLNSSVSRRIVMPRYTDLNPHVDVSNPDVIRSGNPYLDPPVIWNFELNYSYISAKFSNSFSLFYRNEQNKIARIFTPTETDNVYLSRPDNISEAISYGFDISQKIKILKNWNISTYAIIYQYTLDGDNLDKRAENEGLMGSVKLNSSLKLPKNFGIGVTYNYIGQKIVVNGCISPTSFLNISLFKSMLDKKLQLSLKINDILSSRKTSNIIYANGSYSEFDRSYNSRIIIIGASYKFNK